MIAALFVDERGPYAGLPDVDAWGITRDARLYAGPYPVVAHPPCARWCRLAKLVASQGGKAVGDDEGTFAAALASVRAWGGVLEHPAWSLAWGAHGLLAPPAFGWARTMDGEWVCEVSQAAYGHRAAKSTWLLYVGAPAPPPLLWSRPKASRVVGTTLRATATPAPKAQREAAYRAGRRPSREVAALSAKECRRTPLPFRDLLLSMALDTARVL